MLESRGIGVPMRDGTVLYADVYRPEGSAPVPAVVCRTPYDRSFGLTPPAGLDPAPATEAGLAVVCQDVRGRHGSGGEFYPLVNEGPDGADTLAWVAAQPWCNGAIGMAGRSYAAAAQWLAAVERPPGLRAIAPIVIGSSAYHGWVYQGGAFQLGFNLFWSHMISDAGRRVSVAEQYRHLPTGAPPLLADRPELRYYRDWVAHPTYDAYWEEFSHRERYATVEVPALNVTGWYDLFLGGSLENYVRLRQEGASEAARTGTRLIVGPWAHGSTYGPYPDHSFDVFGDAAQIDLTEAQITFFAHHLQDRRGEAEQSPVRLFVMGENRWRDEPGWPPPGAREQRFYLRRQQGEGLLSRQAPGTEAPDRYVYDPADPAPTIGGPTSLWAPFMRTNSGPMDQRALEARDDVLVFSTPPLERALEVTGHVRCLLHAASSARDTDFVAKLCDVDPEGASRILAEGVLRARYLGGFEAGRPIEPGRAYAFDVDLVATSNVFLPGHRIRLLVTSSSFPRFDRNANTGNAIGSDRPEDLVAARQTVFHDAERASHLLLPVIER